MMNRLADGWSQQNTDEALACFTGDAIYMEPPDIQFYKGHSELRPYFAALKPGTFMRFQNLWFDEARQIGAGEYSFGDQSPGRNCLSSTAAAVFRPRGTNRDANDWCLQPANNESQ